MYVNVKKKTKQAIYRGMRIIVSDLSRLEKQFLLSASHKSKGPLHTKEARTQSHTTARQLQLRHSAN